MDKAVLHLPKAGKRPLLLNIAQRKGLVGSTLELVAEPLLLTIEEAAQALRVSRRHLYKLFSRGEVRRVWVEGRAPRVPRSELEGYVKRLCRQAEARA